MSEEGGILVLPNKAVNAAQRKLAKLHGTPREFAKACLQAGEISTDEALAAIKKYHNEWEAAERTPLVVTGNARWLMRRLQEWEGDSEKSLEYCMVFPSEHARIPTAMFLNPIDAKRYVQSRCKSGHIEAFRLIIKK